MSTLSPTRQTRGMTLVELLVAIAIIGTLVGMLLPAVQAVRESARMSLCRHNLKQISLAALAYHDAKKVLPPGYTGSSSQEYPEFDKAQWLGSLPYLLPHLEQQAIHDRITTNKAVDFPSANTQQLPWRSGTVRPWWSAASDWTVAQYRISSFMCPSAPVTPERRDTLVVLHTYPGWLVGAYFPKSTLGHTHYLASSGYLGDAHGRGYQTRRGVCANRSRTRMAAIVDGTSKTFAFGEATGDEEFSHSWMGGGAMPTAWGLRDQRTWYTFNGVHVAGVNFALCDGSVRTIPRNIDSTSFNQLAAMADGQAPGIPQ